MSYLETSELHEFVSANQQEITEFIHILNTATPMASEIHILEVRMWFDRLESFKQFLKELKDQVHG